MSYNPSARAYEVQRAEGFDSLGGEGWRPARTDDFGKWLQARYTKPRLSATPVTALYLVLDGPEWTKLGLEPKYAYGSKNLAVEPDLADPGAGVRVWIGDAVAGAQAKRWMEALYAGGLQQAEMYEAKKQLTVMSVKPWRLAFGAPFMHTLKVGEYGGAHFFESGPASRYSGPSIWVGPWLPEGAMPKSHAHWLVNNCGEFVVREIELKDHKVVRLAIDFITDTRGDPYDGSGFSKRKGVPRRILRGSLRYNSQFQPSLPESDPDAAE